MAKRKSDTLTKNQRAWVEHARQAAQGKDPEARARFLRGFRNGTQHPEDERFRAEMDELVDKGGNDET